MTQGQEQTRALSIRERSSSFAPGGPISGDEWLALAEIGNVIQDTEFVKKGLRGNGPAIMAAMLYGREQGLGPMVSLQEIDMIDGRPSMSAALTLAKIRAAGHSVVGETGPERALIHGTRADNGDEHTVEFTIEMARRAGLTGKKAWQQYPEAMLWARCVTGLARYLFSDVFIGAAYTAEELGAAELDESGRVIEGEVINGGGPAALQEQGELCGFGGIVGGLEVRCERAAGHEGPHAYIVGEPPAHTWQPFDQEGAYEQAAPTPREAAPDAPAPEPAAAKQPAPSGAAEAARRAQEAAQAQGQPPSNGGGAVDEPSVEASTETGGDGADHLSEIELAEQREANLPIPVGELTVSVIDSMKRDHAIKYLKHFNIEYDPADKVTVYRAMIKTFLEHQSAVIAAGQGGDADPFGDAEPGEQEDPEAEAMAEAEAEARQHRIEQLTKVLEHSEKEGLHWTLATLRERAEKAFGRPIETVADLEDEEIEMVWRNVPEEVKQQAFAE